MAEEDPAFDFASSLRNTKGSSKSKKGQKQSPLYLFQTPTGQPASESPQYSDSFKKARKAASNLYRIWKKEYDESQPSPSNAESSSASKVKFSKPEKVNTTISKTKDKPIGELEFTLMKMQEDAAFFGKNLDAFYKVMNNWYSMKGPSAANLNVELGNTALDV